MTGAICAGFLICFFGIHLSEIFATENRTTNFNYTQNQPTPIQLEQIQERHLRQQLYKDNKQKKKIVDYYGAPKKLKEFESLVDGSIDYRRMKKITD